MTFGWITSSSLRLARQVVSYRVLSLCSEGPWKTTTTWEEQQKMDLVRKTYQKAVKIPMDNLKKFWEDYQDFENSLNKITVRLCHLSLRDLGRWKLCIGKEVYI